jgi:hypothetical protein
LLNAVISIYIVNIINKVNIVNTKKHIKQTNIIVYIYIIRKARTRQNKDIDWFVFVQFWTKIKIFLKLSSSGGLKQKIIAIEPMNRKAGSSISRDKSAAK